MNGRAVEKIRLDNAEENKLLQKCSKCADWKLGIDYEFTARDTPQQNSLSEVAFATLANRGRAMMLQVTSRKIRGTSYGQRPCKLRLE